MLERCLKCRTLEVSRKLTEHHCYPQRLNGGNGKAVKLCEVCHQKLEKLIQEAERRYFENFGLPRKLKAQRSLLKGQICLYYDTLLVFLETEA